MPLLTDPVAYLSSCERKRSGQKAPCAPSHSSPSFPGSVGQDLPRLASDGPDVAIGDIRPICFCGRRRGTSWRGTVRKLGLQWKLIMRGAVCVPLWQRKAFQWNAFVRGWTLS